MSMSSFSFAARDAHMSISLFEDEFEGGETESESEYLIVAFLEERDVRGFLLG